MEDIAYSAQFHIEAAARRRQITMPEPLSDELELLRAMRRGDEAAFTRLYEQHHGAVFRFVLHMTGRVAAAEEVTQEVFMHLIRKPAGFEPSKGTLAAYLFGIARNLARNISRSVRFDVALDEVEEIGSGGDLLEKMSDSQSADALRAALRALPPKYREVVVLCDLEELSYAEAGALLACPTGTLASRLHRAHKSLAARLERFSERRTAEVKHA